MRQSTKTHHVTHKLSLKAESDLVNKWCLWHVEVVKVVVVTCKHVQLVGVVLEVWLKVSLFASVSYPAF